MKLTPQPPSDGYERRPRSNGPRDGQRDRRPRQDGDRRPQGDRRPRQDARPPRQDGERPARRQQNDRPARRQEAAADSASAASAAVEAPATPAGADFFEGIDLATMSSDAAPQRAPRDRAPRDRAPRSDRSFGDRPPRDFQRGGPAGRGGFAARGRGAGGRGGNRGRRGDDRPSKDQLLKNYSALRAELARSATVPLVSAPEAGSTYDLFGPRSISRSVPTGFSEKEIEGMMQLTGEKRWKGEYGGRDACVALDPALRVAEKNTADDPVEQTTLLARLGDYSLFNARLPQTAVGPHGAAQRAKFDLRRNKSYDPATQAVPAMKIVTDAVGVEY